MSVSERRCALDKFPTEEVIVVAVCSLIAYPLCDAGWHEIVAGGDITRGIVGLLFGVPIGLIGLSYHWWKGKIGLIGKAAIYWWPIAVVTSFIYVCGPIIYTRATTFGLFTQAQVDEKIANATFSIRAERDKLIQGRDVTRAQLQTVTKERDAQTQKIAGLQATLGSPRPASDTDAVPIASIVDPITWNNRLLFYSGGDKTIKYIVLYGTNNGSGAEQLKSATLSSEITGETRDFSVEVPAHRIDGKQMQLQNVYPVPPGAEIELIMEWNPTISVSDFISLWGKTRLEINYNSITHRKVFNRENISSMIAQDIVGADAIVGTPRVTPKTP